MGEEEGNPFEHAPAALEWISCIESEGARVREGDIYPKLNAWVESISPQSILEVGCGQGVCSDKIELANRTYTGVDLSPLLLARARQLYSGKGKTFLQGPADSLPVPDAAIDALFSVSVWHLLSDIHQAASEMSRVLKKGGRFLIISANPGAYSLWIGRYTESRRTGARLDGKILHADGSASRDVLFLHTLDEINGALRAARLEILKTETFRPAPTGQHQYVCIEGRKFDCSLD